MIDLKLSKKEKEKNNTLQAAPYDSPSYPWGTRLRFEKEQIDRIDSLKKSQVGQEVRIMAVGKIVEVSTYEADKSNSRRTIEIQITKIDVKGNEKDMPEDEGDAFTE